MSTIKLKRSAVEGKIPGVGDLQLGEVAINTHDGKVYIKKDDGAESIVEVGGVREVDGEVINNFVRTDDFVGNGSNTQFALSITPYNKDHSFVSINGIRQDINTYELNNNILVLDEAVANGDTIEVRTLSSVFSGQKIAQTSELLNDAANTQVVDSFSASTFRTAKYIIQMNDGTDYHSTEVLLMHDNINVYMTEYATLTSNSSLGSIDSEIIDGTVNLLVTPVSANTGVRTLRLALGL